MTGNRTWMLLNRLVLDRRLGLEMDYMGRAEFEFGATHAALAVITADLAMPVETIQTRIVPGEEHMPFAWKEQKARMARPRRGRRPASAWDDSEMADFAARRRPAGGLVSLGKKTGGRNPEERDAAAYPYGPSGASSNSHPPSSSPFRIGGSGPGLDSSSGLNPTMMPPSQSSIRSNFEILTGVSGWASLWSAAIFMATFSTSSRASSTRGCAVSDGNGFIQECLRHLPIR